MGQFRVMEKLPTWRRLALSTWGRGDDPSIYGWIDIDATNLQNYVRRAREETGVRVTLTHVIGKAAAMAFSEHPDCNGVVSLGRLKVRDTVDVFFQVAFEGGQNLSGAKVERADKRSVTEIATQLESMTTRIRGKGDTELQKSQNVLKRAPSILLGPLMRLSEIAMFDFGIDLTPMGVPFDPFGTVMITNVGVFGIDHGFAPLMPLSRTPALLCIGAVRDRPVAHQGRVEIRPVLTIGATFDHRVIDGAHAGKLARVLVPMLEDPLAAFGMPAAVPAARAAAE